MDSEKFRDFPSQPAYNNALIKSAEKMLKYPTHSERDALQQLRRKGVKFESQVVLGFYILDFVIPSKMLIVEIDGPTHEDSKRHDSRRDYWCRSIGMNVIRIPNEHAKTINTRIANYPDVPNADYLWSEVKAEAVKQKSRGR